MPATSPGRLLIIFFLVVITIAVAIVLNTNTALPVPGGGTGTLTGNVSIGPLCPVEPCMIDPDRLAAAYAARNDCRFAIRRERSLSKRSRTRILAIRSH